MRGGNDEAIQRLCGEWPYPRDRPQVQKRTSVNAPLWLLSRISNTPAIEHGRQGANCNVAVARRPAQAQLLLPHIMGKKTLNHAQYSDTFLKRASRWLAPKNLAWGGIRRRP
jgi:hypothetical protein